MDLRDKNFQKGTNNKLNASSLFKIIQEQIDKGILGKFDHRNNHKIILQLLCHIKSFKLLKIMLTSIWNSSKVTGMAMLRQGMYQKFSHFHTVTRTCKSPKTKEFPYAMTTNNIRIKKNHQEPKDKLYILSIYSI